MSTKLKIYIVSIVLVIIVIISQLLIIRNLKNELHETHQVVNILEQNHYALTDSINFKSDSVAVLHSFIKNQKLLNSELESLYESIKETSKNNIKDLKNQIGLLSGEIKLKDQIITDLQGNTTDINSTDSTLTIPILYSNNDMGLKLDGYAVGNFIDKTGYVYWNKIEVSLPKMRIGLVYDKADSSVVALIEASGKIETFKTTMSDNLFSLIINNPLQNTSWLNNIYITNEINFYDVVYISSLIEVSYKNIFIAYGKSLNVSTNKIQNVYKIYYKCSLNYLIEEMK